MQNQVEAYLDIETTGLSSLDSMVTVVGIYICNGDDTKVTQLIGKDITSHNILEALEGVDKIYTYNGSRFDLPFIHDQFGINLAGLFAHHDLMYDCWQRNLYGGFKLVERQLGISRELVEVNGYEAIRLWWKYVDSFDLEALDTLLQYNKEDIINLRTLKEILLDTC